MGGMGRGKGGGKAAAGKGKGRGKGQVEEEVVAGGHGGGEGWLRETMEDLTEVVKSAEKWVESISKRASLMEMRMMQQRCLVHEAMRSIVNHLVGFRPMGDSGWILRSTQDSMASAEKFLMGPLFECASEWCCECEDSDPAGPEGHCLRSLPPRAVVCSPSCIEEGLCGSHHHAQAP